MELASFAIIILSLFPFIISKLTGKFIYFAFTGLLVVIVHGMYLFGPKILLFLVIIYVVSTVAELISLKTSFNIFGVPYSYNLKHPFFSSGANFMDVYPLEISLVWVLFKYISFNISLLIVQAFSFSYFWIVFLAPLVLLSMDLIIDPVAVNESKLWKWKKGSSYFLGWFLVGFISSLIFSSIDTGKTFIFNPLYVLPIIFYAMVIRNAAFMFRIDKIKAILGTFPMVLWTVFGIVSLLMLYFRQY
jgi:hypothetical protein